jgi:hypothetical protein
MEKKFTQGEWYLKPYTDAYTNIIRCNIGNGHETIYLASTLQSPNAETRHNALLMSKAPLLLEAVEDLLKSLQEIDWPPNLTEHLGNLCMNAEQLLIDATTL